MASLLELQNFLSEDLFDESSSHQRAFLPLTEGLGLASPRALTPKIDHEEKDEIDWVVKPVSNETSAKSVDVPPPLPDSPKLEPFKISVKSMRKGTRPPKEHLFNENRLADVIETIPNNKTYETENKNLSEPPPLPRPAMFKRLFAGIIDQVFVLFIWTGFIVVTSNLMNGFSTGFSIEIISDFALPKFQRIAILEFAAAWLGYLGFSLLVFKRTFGMWVWSLGVSYGDSVDENYLLRKAMRIFWTFIFSAPVVPSLLLAVRKNGRNVLDILSGTNVYDAD